jgi:fibro-slime domain-containing protein
MLLFSRIFCIVLSLLIFVTIQKCPAQAAYPDTARFPVTFYDFHSDGSNPEFEAPYAPPSGQLALPISAVHRQMIGSSLDSERKPVLGPVPYANYDIKYWFRPWAASAGGAIHAQGDSTAPSYSWTGANWWTLTPVYNGMVSVGHDTSLKNVVIQDTLAFWSLKDAMGRNTGVYEFTDGGNGFFPIDNRGFGNEGRDHNFSYTMEFHQVFSFRSSENMNFHFLGDDDCWIFVNNRLACDLGGMHSSVADSFNLTSLAGSLGLLDGQRCVLDVFCCERHSPGSDIMIQTNVIAMCLCVGSINLNVNPPVATIPAGDSVAYRATVKDDTGGVRNDLAALVQWRVVGDSANTPLRNLSGPTTTFYGSRAYKTYLVIGSINDPAQPGHFMLDTATVTVLPTPGLVYHLYIEQDSVPDKWSRHPVAQVDLPANENLGYVYAVLRDSFDNLIGFDSSVVWNTRDASVAVVAGAPGKPWIGVITRVTPDPDSTTVVAMHSGVGLDSVKVKLRPWCGLGVRPVAPGTNNLITSIAIYSTAGRLIKRFDVRDNSRSVGRDYAARLGNRAPAGLYLMQIKSGNKITKEHVLIGR